MEPREVGERACAVETALHRVMFRVLNLCLSEWWAARDLLVSTIPSVPPSLCFLEML